MNSKTLCLPLLLAASATSAAAQGPTPPKLNPLHMWLCDDGGGSVLSETYWGQHGTLVNGGGAPIVWSTDTPFPYPGNKSLKFDGVDDHVVLSTQSLASGSTSCTISAWFWRYDDFFPKEYAIWGERDECGGDVFSINVEKRPGKIPSLRFKDFFRTFAGACGAGILNEAITPMIPSAGFWHHVAVVKDPVAGMSMYVDGALVAAHSYTDAYNGYHAETTLGALGPLSTDSFWHGQIDEVALFSYSLSLDEILWLASHSLSELPPPPITYCSAKINSCGSVPRIWAAGDSRASQTSGFAVAGTNWRPNKPGLLMYTSAGAHSSPPAFQGGLLCIAPPIKRSVALVSYGTGGIGACDGGIAIDMNAFASGALGGNPAAFLSTPGTSVDCQWWGRDTPAAGSLLSDAARYVVGP
jgi:hypothetical protein